MGINFIPETSEDEEILAAIPTSLGEIPSCSSKGSNWLCLTLRNEEYTGLCGMSPAASLK
jgi:hypothetical protein